MKIPNWLMNLKPGARKPVLYLLSGLMWSAVGLYLDYLAVGWLIPVVLGTALMYAALGLLLGITIYTFGFSNFAMKNINRIAEIKGEKVCVFAFQAWTSYPLVVFMISLGIFLRIYSPIPKSLLAIMYMGIGTSLFLGSTVYYRYLLNGKKTVVVGE